jgi:hypothetical protein
LRKALKQNITETQISGATNNMILNLAQGLVHLRINTTECCTPGHRMGRGFQVLTASLTKDMVEQDRWQIVLAKRNTKTLAHSTLPEVRLMNHDS